MQPLPFARRISVPTILYIVVCTILGIGKRLGLLNRAFPTENLSGQDQSSSVGFSFLRLSVLTSPTPDTVRSTRSSVDKVNKL